MLKDTWKMFKIEREPNHNNDFRKVKVPLLKLPQLNCIQKYLDKQIYLLNTNSIPASIY